MLVLSRRKDEKIIIGDNITIMVIEIRGEKVRLGIECPREIPVHREEVWESIQRENAEKIQEELLEKTGPIILTEKDCQEIQELRKPPYKCNGCGVGLFESGDLYDGLCLNCSPL